MCQGDSPNIWGWVLSAWLNLNETLDALEYCDGAEEEEDPEEDMEEEPPGREPRCKSKIE